MKRQYFLTILATLVLAAAAVWPVAAQNDAPPTPGAGPTGTISVTLVNRNTGKLVTESLEVMLHIMDLDFVDQDMLHGQSLSDGTYVFTDVPFAPGLQFAVMATYQGATYFSETTPADMSSLQASLEVPVYESTSDLSNLQVEQMHVVFALAEDGLETREIYIISNHGERTVKDAYRLEDGSTATLEFPLPEDADFIFFKPDEQDRFVKLTGGFADTQPVSPQSQDSQFMVTYLVPYSGERNYTYTAPMNMAQLNFLLPDQAGLTIQGGGLMGPQSMTLQSGGAYQVYSSTGLKAGQTLSFTISGQGVVPAAGRAASNLPAVAGLSFAGALLIGGGLWLWRRQRGAMDETGDPIPASEVDFDHVVNEIARLDQTRESGEIEEEEYRRSRAALMEQAKALLGKNPPDAH